MNLASSSSASHPSTRTNSQKIAVAAIINDSDEVLLSLRPQHTHQGGLWEFPGGKIESGENTKQALERELFEELGIKALEQRPLIRIQHDYADKSVLLDVWRVDTFNGEPYGKEGQEIAWTSIQKLREKKFPAANQPIITAVTLASTYLITPDLNQGQHKQFFASLEKCLDSGIRLAQLRLSNDHGTGYQQTVQRALALCRRYNKAQLLLNSSPQQVEALGADGVHLNSQRLMSLEQRPLPANKWVAASCHNLIELKHACQIGVDFIVVSPVMPTLSHPGAPTLGWDGLKELAEEATVPVFALGGMTLQDLDRAFHNGAQGIAGISGLWE